MSKSRGVVSVIGAGPEQARDRRRRATKPRTPPPRRRVVSGHVGRIG
jgi:hypothetical protein